MWCEITSLLQVFFKKNAVNSKENHDSFYYQKFMKNEFNRLEKNNLKDNFIFWGKRKDKKFSTKFTEFYGCFTTTTTKNMTERIKDFPYLSIINHRIDQFWNDDFFSISNDLFTFTISSSTLSSSSVEWKSFIQFNSTFFQFNSIQFLTTTTTT